MFHTHICRYSSCHDLLLSRFCAADYRDYGIIGIKIHRITRIHNRMLRTKFDEKVAQLVEEEEQANTANSNTSINSNHAQATNQQAAPVQVASPAACPATRCIICELRFGSFGLSNQRA